MGRIRLESLIFWFTAPERFALHRLNLTKAAKKIMNQKYIALIVVAVGYLFTPGHSVFAQGTAFTYQGQLSASGSPASGQYDFTFALYNNSSTNTGQVGITLTNLDAGVTNGLFTTTLDFGPNFPGASRWLSISVRSNNVGSYTALTPLQELTPTPYAIYTPNAGSAGDSFWRHFRINGDHGQQCGGRRHRHYQRRDYQFGFRGQRRRRLTNLNASQLTSIGNTNPPAIGNFFVSLAGNATTLGQYNTAIEPKGRFRPTQPATTTRLLAVLRCRPTRPAWPTRPMALWRSDTTRLAPRTRPLAPGRFRNLETPTTPAAPATSLWGHNAGSAYTASESSSIDIGNVGSLGENNIIRIGGLTRPPPISPASLLATAAG